MKFERLEFSRHAILRMFRRKISAADVRTAIETGEVIETYSQDIPYPSLLILGYAGNRPLHVVVANDSENNRGIVVTIYHPDPLQWEAGFRKRRLM